MIQERRCDFHTHTVHSDGTLTPRALVALARERGLSCIALTDHDTLNGVEEAQTEGRRIGVEVIAGVEVSVRCDFGTMHILGYFVDRNSNILRKGLESVQEARRKRNPLIIEKLKAEGVLISMEEVKAASGGGQIGRPHFARVLLEKGYVKSTQEAFDRYLAKGKPAYVDKRTLESGEAIRLIESSGGIAVLAHPKMLKLDDRPEEFERTLKTLQSEGLKGLEVYSSCQSARESNFYKKIADRLGLIATGGSDFHGENRPHVLLGWMGDGVTIPYETVDRMKKMILDHKTK